MLVSNKFTIYSANVDRKLLINSKYVSKSNNGNVHRGIVNPSLSEVSFDNLCDTHRVSQGGPKDIRNHHYLTTLHINKQFCRHCDCPQATTGNCTTDYIK